MNGFDQVADGEDNWFHGPRSLPPTPQEYHASLRRELQKLKDAISMPNEEFARPKRTVKKRGRKDEEPRQKTMDVVDGRRSDSLDELLANFEFARIKEWVEKRRCQAAQVTVTPVDTVQHCGPCPLDPEASSVYVNLENNQGKMGPELKELESLSASMGLKMPGQQCLPNEGTWEAERTTACQGGHISSSTERVKSTRITADTTCLQQGHKPRSEENKQFDPGGKSEKASTWNAAVTLLFFSWGELEGSLVVLRIFCLCLVCALFPKLFFPSW